MIHRLSLLLRIVRARPRLFSAAALGISVTVALGLLTHWWRATCLLAGWDIGVAVYLVLAIFMMACSDIESIRRRASEEDDGQFVILVLTVAAALVSLAAIFIELGTSGTGGSRAPSSLRPSPSCCRGPSSTRCSRCTTRMSSMMKAMAAG